MADPTALPDLTAGIWAADVPDGGVLIGRVGDSEVLVARRGADLFAVGAFCTHYQGRLAAGLVVGDTIRCPLHHACFSLRTGEALRAPAFDPIDCWDVVRVGDRVFVGTHRREPARRRAPPVSPDSVAIVGGGAAGFAAADMLRREGYAGVVTVLSADSEPPCDRPILSKDYLAGTAEDAWVPLKSEDYYRERRIDVWLGARVARLDPQTKTLYLTDGRTLAFGACLLATGAEPIQLSVPGAAPGQVLALRTLADSRAIASRASSAKRALVIGASFIGLEVAAALRERGLEVHVVAPESQPLVRVLGDEVGLMIRRLHESRGVRFHLGATVSRLEERAAMLSDGTRVEDLDLIVAGVGVRAAVALAEQAGLALDRGVLVNAFLETSVPGIYAAGDIARWPDARSGTRVRVEHWVVAERQGQIAARNMLGLAESFDAVPFFWSRHYDISIQYVGHAETWDSIEIDGNLDGHDALVRFRLSGRVLAVATIGRGRSALQTEAQMEPAASSAR